jgi:hypothetical protein
MKTLIAIFSFLFISSAFAATTCTDPGNTCAGSVTVSVEVGPLVQLSGVQDINIRDWNGGAYSNDQRLVQNFCVFSNTAGVGGTYTIAFTDTNNNFLLKNAANSNDVAKYQLEFISGTDTAPTTTIVTGPTTLSNQVGSASMTCNGSTNTTLKVSLLGSVNGALLHAGNYTDTLSMLVTPT